MRFKLEIETKDMSFDAAYGLTDGIFQLFEKDQWVRVSAEPLDPEIAAKW